MYPALVRDEDRFVGSALVRLVQRGCGSKFVVLMSLRAQRVSSTRITSTPLRTCSSRAPLHRRTVIKMVGFIGPSGTCERGPAPRVICT